MTKPDFLIVGACKAGTSNLRKLLMQHPTICMSHREIWYFQNDKIHNKGTEWYLDHFKHAQPGQVVGEKSPAYYSFPSASKWIHELLPDVKLIWILREPVSRSYSDYWFAVFRGRELKSFDEAIRLELEGKRKNIARHYLNRSTYIELIERYLKYFPKEQMHFVQFEAMKRDPAKAAKECFSFLGVDENVEIVQKDEHKNPTYLPLFPIVNYVANQLFRHSIPKIYYIIRRINQKRTPGYPAIDQTMKKRLKAYFKPFNEQLETFTGWDLSSWNK